MDQSALVVFVPEAEPLVCAWRERYDPAAARGVPAHVTLLYPFVAPAAIDDDVHAALATLFAQHPAFDFRLQAVARFPHAAYLAPDPAAPFIALTRGIEALFPAYPPYGGAHDDVVPHLTVGQGDAHEVDAVSRALQAALDKTGAVEAHCRSVQLLDNVRGPWQVRRTYSLDRKLD